MPLTDQMLKRGFALVEQAAVAGERCPQNQPFGPLATGITTALARAGKIRLEIFAHNWRVAEILTGPHAGKRTMRTPHDGSRRPYKTIGVETVMTTLASRRSNAPVTLARITALETSDFD